MNSDGEEPAASAAGWKSRAGRGLKLAGRLLIFILCMVPALAATTVLMAVTNPSVLYVERHRVLLTYSWWNAWRWVRETPRGNAT